MDSSVKYLITIAVGVIALILVIVLPLSFSDVEYYEVRCVYTELSKLYL